MITRHFVLWGVGAAMVAAAIVPLAAQRAPTQCPQAPPNVLPVLAGVRCPGAVLFAPDGRQVMLHKVFATRPTVLVVYDGNWCVYCQKELERMQAIEPDLLRLGYQIVAISPDSPQNLNKGLGDRQVGYRLLSDMQQSVATDLGVLYYLDENTRTGMEFQDWTVNNVSAQPQWRLPEPSVFIVDTDGRIRFEQVGATYHAPLDPSALLGAAKCLMGAK